MARRLVEHLERDGFLLIKKQPAPGQAALGRGALIPGERLDCVSVGRSNVNGVFSFYCTGPFKRYAKPAFPPSP